MERGIRHGEAARRQDFEFTAVPAAAWGPPTGEGMKLSHMHATRTLISPKAQKRLGTLIGDVGPAEPQSLGAAISIEGNTNPIRPKLDEPSTILQATACSIQKFGTLWYWTLLQPSSRHAGVIGVLG